MTHSTYPRSRSSAPVRSPYQPVAKRPEFNGYDFSDPQHPVRHEVRKLCGTITLEASFKEDVAALETYKHVPGGAIAIICTLRKDGQVVGEGRANAWMNRMNKNIERSAFMAFNNAFTNAAMAATRVFDSLRIASFDKHRPEALGGAYTADYGPSEPATDKQISYLRQLLSLKIEDETEREQWESQLSGFTKEEASEAIQKLTA